MTTAVWYLFSAGGMVAALVVVTSWIVFSPHSRWARRALIALALFYGLASTYGVSHHITRMLGAGFRPFEASDVPRGRTAIVVLGSGNHSAADSEGRTLTNLDPWGAGRAIEAVRVFNLVNPELVISSGGLRIPGDVESTGVTMRDTLVRLGLPADRIRAVLESLNTHEEAANIVPLLKSLGIEHTILVTSHIHMRRSVGTFKAEGMTVIPAIAPNIEPPDTWQNQLLPSDHGLVEAASAIHEVLGLIYYTLRGWYSWS